MAFKDTSKIYFPFVLVTFCSLREDSWRLYSVDCNSILKQSCRSICACLCVFDRDLGGEAVLREAIRGALSAQRERYCLSHRGLCHHAAGMWHAGGGQTAQQTHTHALNKHTHTHSKQTHWGDEVTVKLKGTLSNEGQITFFLKAICLKPETNNLSLFN